MNTLFRFLLFIISTGTLFFVLLRIRKSQAQIEGAVFWIVFTLGLVAVSIFPGAAIRISALIGIESPANFVFLCIIFLLLMKVFSISMQMSKMQYQIRRLTQIIALGEEQSRDIGA